MHEALRRAVKGRAPEGPPRQPGGLVLAPLGHARIGQRGQTVNGVGLVPGEIAPHARRVSRQQQEPLALRLQGPGVGPARIGVGEGQNALRSGLLAFLAQVNPFHQLHRNRVMAGDGQPPRAGVVAFDGGVNRSGGGVLRRALAAGNARAGSEIGCRRLAVIARPGRLRRKDAGKENAHSGDGGGACENGCVLPHETSVFPR